MGGPAAKDSPHFPPALLSPPGHPQGALTGLVVAVRDSISSWVIHTFPVDWGEKVIGRVERGFSGLRAPHIMDGNSGHVKTAVTSLMCEDSNEVTDSKGANVSGSKLYVFQRIGFCLVWFDLGSHPVVLWVDSCLCA